MMHARYWAVWALVTFALAGCKQRPLLDTVQSVRLDIAPQIPIRESENDAQVLARREAGIRSAGAIRDDSQCDGVKRKCGNAWCFSHAPRCACSRNVSDELLEDDVVMNLPNHECVEPGRLSELLRVERSGYLFWRGRWRAITQKNPTIATEGISWNAEVLRSGGSCQWSWDCPSGEECLCKSTGHEPGICVPRHSRNRGLAKACMPPIPITEMATP